MCVECLIEDREIGLGCGAAVGIHSGCCLVCCIEIGEGVTCRMLGAGGVAVDDSVALEAGL